jgi:hypothetical protein
VRLEITSLTYWIALCGIVEFFKLRNRAIFTDLFRRSPWFSSVKLATLAGEAGFSVGYQFF